ncbi:MULTISPECIES: hypothetical protein [unclassified Mesorhizobium]|uniref:hypothetical protein n=1 Tax=unclassified Mesorhizobium TaxID=325217 RepID=UPI0033370864
MSSLLAAVREAVRAPTDDDSLIEGNAPGAQASTETSSPLRAKETGMSGQNAPAAADTILPADHNAAVAAAETKGHTAGVAAESKRLSTALGAEGVKGDGGRMAAALDLASKSPAMSGEDVAAFVVANVSQARAAAAHSDAYEESRLAAAGLAQPGVGKNADSSKEAASRILANYRASTGASAKQG